MAEPLTSSSQVVSGNVTGNLRTTADSWNRIRDKARIEDTLKLPEFWPPAPPTTTTTLSSTTASTSSSSSCSPSPPLHHQPSFWSLGQPSELIATGYSRVVYGDHGPYIECEKEQIHFHTLHLNEGKAKSATLRYYDEWWTADRTVMVYEQRRDVSGKANPPRDGKAGAVARGAMRSGKSGSGEAEDAQDGTGGGGGGYADYRAGKFYIDPAQIRVVWVKPMHTISTGVESAATRSPIQGLSSPTLTGREEGPTINAEGGTTASPSGQSSSSVQQKTAKGPKKNRLQ